jgi:hypothetical protein
MATTDAHFHNQLYRVEISRTTAGSPILKITATNPTGRYAGSRRLAAFVYDLAAQLERRSDETGAHWAISPEALDGRITIELGGSTDREREHADDLIAELIAENQLATKETKR